MIIASANQQESPCRIALQRQRDHSNSSPRVRWPAILGLILSLPMGLPLQALASTASPDAIVDAASGQISPQAVALRCAVFLALLAAVGVAAALRRKRGDCALATQGLVLRESLPLGRTQRAAVIEWHGSSWLLLTTGESVRVLAREAREGAVPYGERFTPMQNREPSGAPQRSVPVRGAHDA